jgi:hypothetical protein
MGKGQSVTACTCSASADVTASRLSVFAGNCDDLGPALKLDAVDVADNRG